MALLEAGPVGIKIPDTKAESKEPEFSYDISKAKNLASYYLQNKNYESRGSSEAEYLRGKMDIIAEFLVKLGLASVLALDSRDTYELPIVQLRSLKEPEIDGLFDAYKEAHDFLINSGFFGKRITNITASEGYTRGREYQLETILRDMGFGKRVEEVRRRTR